MGSRIEGAKILMEEVNSLSQEEWINKATEVLSKFITLSSTPDKKEWGLNALEAIKLLNTPV